MQLKVSVGFRAIHCKNCGKQERVLRNRCSCDAIWHQCPLHRVDPPFHKSGKAAKRGREETEEAGKKARLMSSTRQAPDVADEAPLSAKIQVKKRGSQQSEERLKASKPNPENRGPISKILERVRSKEAKRKAQQDEVAQRPTKAQCEEVEGGWKLEDEQLKAYWACFPLPTTAMSSDKTGADSALAAEATSNGMQGETSHTRKQLLKALNTSINEQGKVDAKRRKCHQAAFDPNNSGEDHIKPNWDIKVEALNQDLQGNRIRKWESQAIVNIINAGKRR